ncbi:MAG: ADP-ribosylglycohydrolase family protein [Methanoregula sp.]|nr:MAG: ADP-ribosylglycohydrolase family protein [Methanoregula sp.]
MSFISDHKRSCATLIGLAIGDAFGAPLEGFPAPRKMVTDMLPGGRHPRTKGEVTDDTLQALAVAASLVTCRGFDPDDLIVRLVAAYQNNPQWFGPTSSAVFELVRSGVPPHEAAAVAHGQLGSSRSNGSVMRGFPLGVFYAPRSVGTFSIACSRLTHYDMVAAHSSVWLNTMTSAMCRGSTREEAHRMASARCRNDEVFTMLADYKNHSPQPSLDALLCAHAALSCFMTSDSFEEALVTAVNLGGDADTVGACCGALAGACWGMDAIPGRWVRDLVDYPRISSVAHELAVAAED